MNAYKLGLILFMTFFIQNYFLLIFLDGLFKIRGGTAMMVFFSVINAVLNLALKFVIFAPTPVAYVGIVLFHCIQIYFTTEECPLTKVTFAFIIPIHVMAASYIIDASFCLFGGYTYYELFTIDEVFLMSRIITAITIAVIILGMNKVFGLKYFNILKKHPERMKLFIGLEILILCQLIVFSTMLMTDFSQYLLINMIHLAIGSLGIFYLGIFMLVGFKMLEDYRIYSHSKLLENIYRNMLIEKSERTVEINCKTGKVLNYVLKGEILTNLIGIHYESVVCGIIENRIHDEDRSSYIEKHKLSYMTVMGSGAVHSYYYCEYRLQNDDGDYAWYKDFISVQKEGSNSVKAVIVSNNIQGDKNMEFNATMDGLSGLYNKKATTELITQHLEQAQGGIMFMVDIDNFKSVNDNFGHDVGDDVIKEVATKLTYLFNKEDIVGRMGGDEFMIFIKCPTSLNIDAKANQICEAIYKTYYQDGINVTISSSIGICEVNPYIQDFAGVYKVADKALYESKRRGKNTYTIRKI
ncbi:MAG: hypothetical protein ATN33_08870 [Epulopiscium sp. Nele67-Bin001]|nr:MAG: hypothetical protein ATN33_08870 [Epulopiscium sp. Nele67-Bin001]